MLTERGEVVAVISRAIPAISVRMVSIVRVRVTTADTLAMNYPGSDVLSDRVSRVMCGRSVVPYRDRARVERWLAEFWESHSVLSEQLAVLDEEFQPGQNSGLVVASLRRSPGVSYLSVKILDDRPYWKVTFEPRPEAVELDGSGTCELADEIHALGILCDYLQRRTDDAIERYVPMS